MSHDQTRVKAVKQSAFHTFCHGYPWGSARQRSLAFWVDTDLRYTFSVLFVGLPFLLWCVLHKLLKRDKLLPTAEWGFLHIEAEAFSFTRCLLLSSHFAAVDDTSRSEWKETPPSPFPVYHTDFTCVGK